MVESRFCTQTAQVLTLALSFTIYVTLDKSSFQGLIFPNCKVGVKAVALSQVAVRINESVNLKGLEKCLAHNKG